ncbi:MAG TPA: DUF2461 domain-containing protein [bacterium]|nr:DUF2461 domain-containing protein [bacterium]
MTNRTFQGFSRDTVSFFHELEENNERAWFEANRERYQLEVVQPAQAFVLAMNEPLHSVYPGLQADPRPNGAGSIFRIHRDTRFSRDKRPYKTNLGIFFWHGWQGKRERPGYYVHLEGNSLALYCGLYEFSSEKLLNYRRAAAPDTKSGSAQACANPFFRILFKGCHALLQGFGKGFAQGAGQQRGHNSIEALPGPHAGAFVGPGQGPDMDRPDAHRSPGPDDAHRRGNFFDSRTNSHTAGLPAEFRPDCDLSLQMHLLDALIPFWPFFQVGQYLPDDLNGCLDLCLTLC